MKSYLALIAFILFYSGSDGSVTFKIDAQWPGTTQAEFNINGEKGAWTLEMHYDNKVKLKTYNGDSIKIKTSDEKAYTLTGNPINAGQSLTIKYEASYDHNPGANLISAKYNGKPVDIGIVTTEWPITIAPIGVKGHYNYGKAIHASLLFYEAQRAGKLPKDNRIHWRGDSYLDDGKDVGHDLTGGYFDAGDQVKFNFPMAFTLTTLGWGLVDYEDAYSKAGELENMRKAIKWGTDYFIKCHTSDNELYGQVGNGKIDHSVWGRPEEWPKDKARPAYKVTSAHGGSDLAGETAAALAAAAIAFKKADPTYSSLLLKHAKSIYTFADKHRDTYTTEITDAKSFYISNGFGDELAWGAAWLLRATNDQFYQKEVDKHFKEFSGVLSGGYSGYSWDTKTAGVHALMAQVTGQQKYKDLIKNFCDWLVHKAPRTPKGLAFLGEWGSLRGSAGPSFVCLQAAKLGIETKVYQEFAKSQIGYILGDTGRSFVVGVGVNPPTHPHHRASSCPNPPANCDYWTLSAEGPNPHILTGALVGGPDQHDNYNDTRLDAKHNEVADDYNAGFQSALAALLHLQS